MQHKVVNTVQFPHSCFVPWNSFSDGRPLAGSLGLGSASPQCNALCASVPSWAVSIMRLQRVLFEQALLTMRSHRLWSWPYITTTAAILLSQHYELISSQAENIRVGKVSCHDQHSDSPSKLLWPFGLCAFAMKRIPWHSPGHFDPRMSSQTRLQS